MAIFLSDADHDDMIGEVRAIDRGLEELSTIAKSALLERARVAAILKRFYLAEMSLSALQPVLELAVELNPELVATFPKE